VKVSNGPLACYLNRYMLRRRQALGKLVPIDDRKEKASLPHVDYIDISRYSIGLFAKKYEQFSLVLAEVLWASTT